MCAGNSCLRFNNYGRLHMLASRATVGKDSRMDYHQPEWQHAVREFRHQLCDLNTLQRSILYKLSAAMLSLYINSVDLDGEHQQ